MRYVIEIETMASEGLVPTSRRVVTPERDSTLEVISPSVGHACIRLKATYLTAANRGGGQRYSVRICMAPGGTSSR